MQRRPARSMFNIGKMGEHDAGFHDLKASGAA
jgi:hypothetical protein